MRAAKYPEAEEATANEIRVQRGEGKKVTRRTIVATMRRFIAEKFSPIEANKAKLTAPWRIGFTTRFGFSWRRATNRKPKSIVERLPAVRRYFARLARRLARHAQHGPQADGEVIKSCVFCSIFLCV